MLDWDTGETVMSIPVSTLSKYNNMAVGMMQGENGNALYVPTNNMELLCLRDRFAYLPEKPFADLDIKQMERRTCTEEQIKEAGEDLEAVSYIHSAIAEQIGEPTIIAYRVNGLSEKCETLQLLVQRRDGRFIEYSGDWSLTDENGNPIDEKSTLDPSAIYEVRLSISDDSEYDLSDEQYVVKTTVLLAK